MQKIDGGKPRYNTDYDKEQKKASTEALIKSLLSPISG
jgi:hypothetical protein